MKTSRQRILEYLEVKGAASALDISRALHLTSANIRRHLSILLQQGTVEVIGEHKCGQAGRPARRYAPTRRVSAHNLDSLADILLQELVECTLPSERQRLLRKLAGRLAAKGTMLGRNFTQRLFSAVKHLNDMNYSAHWEARPAAPRLILGHCPYAAILPEHPELCQMDVALLEVLLGASVAQISRLERTPIGLRQCVFQVREPQEISL